MKYSLTLLILTSMALFGNETQKFNLLQDLDNASQISTRTKLNMNQTPSVVSVLHASELQKLGITNVYDALETVPGIEVSLGIAGAKQISMRGNKSIVTDKLKFMVDGVSINAELSGANHFYLNMPIEQIERIEIIRGPASALYGSFANIGVINIITKAATHKKSIYYVRASNEGSNNLGFTQNVNSKDMKIALSAFRQKNNHSREYNNYSTLPNKGPFTSYEDFTDSSFALNLEFYKDIHVLSRYLQHNSQNYFGYGAAPIVQDPKNIAQTSWINELEYTPYIIKNLSADLKAGYKTYSMIGKSRLYPYTKLGTHSDLIGSGNYKENKIYTDLSLKYELKDNDIIIGTYLAQTRADNTTYYLNNPSVSNATTIPLTNGGLSGDIRRTQYAFYLSDIINFSEKWSANLGLRYDNYSDSQSSLSPKLALLYNFDEKQSYKLLYQRSFRAPSFVEIYGSALPFFGNANLKPETIDTTEFAYRYQRNFQSWIGVNLFYSQTQNFIYRDPSFRFKNGKDTNSFGVELEFKQPLFSVASVQGNYSYIDNRYKNSNKQVALSAKNLANLMLSYKIMHNFHSGTHIRYVGKRKRESGDPREALNAYTTLDQTFTYTYKEISFQASAKNIFNTAVVFPAPYVQGSTTRGTYLDDLVQTGRTLWLSAQWEFQ